MPKRADGRVGNPNPVPRHRGPLKQVALRIVDADWRPASATVGELMMHIGDWSLLVSSNDFVRLSPIQRRYLQSDTRMLVWPRIGATKPFRSPIM